MCVCVHHIPWYCCKTVCGIFQGCTSTLYCLLCHVHFVQLQQLTGTCHSHIRKGGCCVVAAVKHSTSTPRQHIIFIGRGALIFVGIFTSKWLDIHVPSLWSTPLGVPSTLVPGCRHSFFFCQLDCSVSQLVDVY